MYYILLLELCYFVKNVQNVRKKRLIMYKMYVFWYNAVR